MEFWQQIAQERLRTYDALHTAVENIPIELEDMHISGAAGSNRRLNSLVAKRTLQQRFLQAQRQLRQVDKALAVLTPEQRLVLQMMDISRSPGNCDRLCQLLNCESSTIYYKRQGALKRFTAALFAK